MKKEKREDYLLIISGSCNNWWNVFSANPVWLSTKPLLQYSHCIMYTVWYGTIYTGGSIEITISGQIPQSLFLH